VKLLINKHLDNKLIFAGYVVVSIFTLYVVALLFPDINTTARLWYYLIWFYVGYILRKFVWLDFAVKNHLLVMIVGLIMYLIVFLNIVRIPNSDIRSLLTGLFASAVLIYIFNQPLKFSLGIKNKLALLGKKSLDIYMLHY